MHLLRLFKEHIEQWSGHLTDGYQDAPRKTSLAGSAESGADDGLGGFVEVGIGHDDEMVFRAAQRLHALAVFSGVLINVLGDGRRADERDSAHQWMAEQRV